MATKQSTVDYIIEQIQPPSQVTYRKMFGEYAIYYNGKVVALVCDDQLFVKRTAAGKTFIVKSNDIVEAPAYPGAKPSYLISGEYWDDSDWLTQLINITAMELPLPKQKQKPKQKEK